MHEPRSSLLHIVTVLATGASLACLLPGSGAADAQPAAAAATIDTLANGMRVVVLTDPEAPTISASLWIAAGRAHNPRGSEGVADLAAQCDHDRVAAAMQAGDLGKSYMRDALSVDVEADHIRFAIESLPGDLAPALGVLRALVPAVDEKFDNAPALKRVAMGGLVRSRTAPGVVAQEAFAAAACGMRTPLGLPATFAAILGLRAADIRDFHRRYVVPEAAVLTLSGGIDRARAVTTAGTLFADWPPAAPEPAPWPRSPIQAAHPGLYLIDDPDAEQTLILGGVAVAGRESEHYGELQLLQAVLARPEVSATVHRLAAGQPGGYAYLVKLRPSARGSFLLLQATVATESAPAVLAALRAEVDRIAAGATDAALLDAILASRRDEIRLADQSPDAVLSRQLPFLLAGRGLEAPGVEAPIDHASWQRTVSEALAPDRQCWIVLGQAEELAAKISPDGEIEPAGDIYDVMSGKLFTPEAPAVTRIWDSGPPAASDIAHAEELLLQAIDARGGFAALERVETYEAEITHYRQPLGAVLRSSRTRRVHFPDRLREDWGMAVPGTADTTQRLTLIQAIDGPEVWRNQLGQVRPASGRRAQELRNTLWRDPLRVLLRYGEPGTGMRLLEPEVIAGTSTPGIELKSQEGFWVRLYFHPDSYQVVKQVYQRLGERVPVLVEEFFTDYRDVGGVYVPFKSALKESDEFIGEDHLEYIEYNVSFPADLFARPSY